MLKLTYPKVFKHKVFGKEAPFTMRLRLCQWLLSPAVALPLVGRFPYPKGLPLYGRGGMIIIMLRNVRLRRQVLLHRITLTSTRKFHNPLQAFTIELENKQPCFKISQKNVHILFEPQQFYHRLLVCILPSQFNIFPHTILLPGNNSSCPETYIYFFLIHWLSRQGTSLSSNFYFILFYNVTHP